MVGDLRCLTIIRLRNKLPLDLEDLMHDHAVARLSDTLYALLIVFLAVSITIPPIRGRRSVGTRGKGRCRSREVPMGMRQDAAFKVGDVFGCRGLCSRR